MGKNRDKQRTKGNLKPSSSGQAAALVTRGGSLGFVGFDGQGSANLGYVPMTTSLGDDVDNSVDASFRMLMRKLTKKDSLTKYKALQEFCELCKNSKSEVVECVLPYWPKLYNKLAMDIDHRVREATQEAMLQLVIQVGRNLAPHLKSLVGIWLCAQFDSYATVASKAQLAFQTAFSGAKQVEALMFCRLGLCEFLEDNILRQTADTLSDSKTVSKEDRDTKYNRVVSSSVLALGHLMSVSSEEINTEMNSRYQEILDEKKLWKLARHSSSIVRSSVFSLVITACIKIPLVIHSVSCHVCPVVLSSLDESEPAVCHTLWGAVLSVLHSIPDCWGQVNIRKAVLPKLWSVLRSGGKGSASVIFPSLLPFISKMPKEVIESGIGFYCEFFDNLKEGLTDTRLLSSPSECAVVITTYMECLRYCLCHSALHGSNAWSVRGYLIKDQLLPLIQTSIEPGTKIPTMHLYPAVGDLLNHLSKDNDSSTREERPDLDEDADIILEWFWQGFGSICLAVTENDEKLTTAMVESLAHCLLCLKSPTLISKKVKKNKVVFAETSSDCGSEPAKSKEVVPSAISVNVEALYGGHLLDLVCKICSLSANRVKNKNQSSIHLGLLAMLFPHFISAKLLQLFLEKENSDDFNRLCEEFLGSVVYPLITEYSNHQDGQVGSIISIMFGVWASFSEEAQVQALNRALEFNGSTNFLFILLQKGMQSSLPGIPAWLRSQQGSDRIQELLRVAELSYAQIDERDALWGILNLCLCSVQKGPLINKPCMDYILENFVNCLRRKQLNDLPKMLKLLLDYFSWCKHQPGDLSSASEDILLALFLLQFSHTQFDKEVLATWQAGVQAVDAQYTGCDVLLVRTSAIITERLKTVNSIDRILSLVGAAVQLLQNTKNLHNNQGDITRKIYYSFVPNAAKCTEWREHKPKGNVLGSYVCDVLPVICHTANVETCGVCDTMDAHQMSVLFAAMVTTTILMEADGLLGEGVVVEDHMLVGMCLQVAFINTWSLCVLGSKNMDGEKNKLPSCFIQTFPNTYRLLEIISPTLRDLLEFLDKNHLLESLLREAVTMAKNQGFLWALVLSNIMMILNKRDFVIDSAGFLADLNSSLLTDGSEFKEKCEPVVQSIVAMIPYIDNIYDIKVLTECNVKFLCQELAAQEFACTFPIVAECLKQWSQLAKHCEEATLEYQLTLIEILDTLMEWKDSNERILLLNASVDDTTAAEVTINIASMKILGLAINHTSTSLNTSHWDFILCGLVGWLQTCEENFSSLSTSILSMSLCRQSCTLHSEVVKFFGTLSENLLREEKPIKDELKQNEDNNDSTSSLVVEWQEFFSENAFSAVMSMFLLAADKCMDSSFQTTLPFYKTCEILGLAVTNTPITNLQHYKYTKHAAEDHGDDTLPQWAQDLLFHFLPLLECPVHSVQIAAYRVMLRAMANISLCHTRKSSDEDEQDEIERSPPLQLMHIVNKSLSHMDQILQDALVPFGHHLCLASDTEALRLSLTLFLASRLLISFFQSTSVENRPEYAAFLRKTKLINNLMSMLYRLMPLDNSTTITETFVLEVDDDVTEALVQELGRCSYYSLLNWMPAMVRQWFNGLEKKHAAIVDRYTSSYITPLLCQQEMERVTSTSLQFTNMQVKARPVAGEVAAVYTVDDISMELVVKLAPNHPLGVVAVDSGRRVGVTTAQWRRWILQMTTFLTHQNGSIMDGLVLWKQNADKHFEGVDECTICFSVIHAANYSLPKLTCKTCKKKFHSICLYRWFNTSNNSTCPLCRNIF